MAKTCARCGERIEPKKHIYSKYTENYYCWDIDACEERAHQPMSFREIIKNADALRSELDINGFGAQP